MAHAQVVTNPPTPFTNTGTINQLIFNDGATHVGDVTNAASGQINFSTPTGGAAVLVNNATTIGNLINNGAISSTATGGVLEGIDTGQGTVASIINNGNITVTGTAAANIGINVGVTTGPVINSGTTTVIGSGASVGVRLLAAPNQDFINSGTLTVSTDVNGANPNAFALLSSNRVTNTSTGTINVSATGTNGFADLFIAGGPGRFQNDGTINVTGAAALGASYLFNSQGAFVNNGTMNITATSPASGNAAAVTWVANLNGTFNGGITNNGTMNVTGAQGPVVLTPYLGGPSAIALSSGLTGQPALSNGGTLIGGITNNGTMNVTGTKSGATGIGFVPVVAIGGTTWSIDAITNNGTMNIKAPITSTGILLENLSGQTMTIGSVTNTGTINATSGIAVFGATITNGITNTGTINAATAINMSGDTTATIINQAGGALNGAVAMSAANGDVLNIMAGTMNGQVTGGATTLLNMTGGTLVVGPTTNDSVGTFRQTGGTLAYNVTPSTMVYGTVTSANPALYGGTFQVNEGAGVYAKSQTYQDVLKAPSAAGAHTVTSASPAFTAALVPGSAGGNKSLVLNFNGFGSVGGLTSNERATAGGLDALIAANPTGAAAAFAGAFAGLNAAQLASALDLVSGEIHASAQTELLNDSLFVRSGILDRLRQAGYASAPGELNALGYAGPALAYQGGPDFPIKAPPAARPDYGLTFWAQAVGAPRGRFDGDANAAGLTRDYEGFLTGVDRRFGDWRLGVAGGASHASLNVDARASSATIDTATLAGYAGGMLGGFNVRTGAAYSWSSVDTTRSIAFPGFADRTTARYDAATAQVFGEVGYGMRFGGFAVEPFAGLAWVNVHTDSFAEAGGGAALNGASNDENVGYSSIGVRAATAFTLMNGTVLVPRAAVAWEHAFGDVNPTATLAFQGAVGSFGITGTPLARDAAVVEAGLDWRVRPNIKLGVSYFGEFGDKVSDNAAKGMFTWNF